MQHLEGLNERQREAVVHTDGPLLVVAGAGAGKTKTIVHRIVNLIKQGASPTQILAVTFTNKAAKEMRERIGEAMIGFVDLGSHDGDGQRKFSAENFRVYETNRGDIPFVSTFHSLGVYIIKENARMLGLTKHFSILDEGDSVSLVKESIKDVGLDPKQYEPRRIKGIISKEKGKFVDVAEYEEFSLGSSDYLSAIVLKVWKRYEELKKKEQALDFDDLLLLATKLLERNEEVRKIYQDRWRYIHIDEYQDTNEVQYKMSRLLAEAHQNICVVGDADQNIYSWRGANLKNILSFERDYKNAKVVMLEENYRSTQNILEAANEVIKKNQYRPDKNLFTKNKAGEKIGLYEALDESDEADFVATKILEIVDKYSQQNFLSRLAQTDEASRSDSPAGEYATEKKVVAEKAFSEIAILYRANFQSRVLEEAMLRYNIPYQVLGVKFFERKEIKDTLAYLRASLNTESLSDIKRIINFPKRGLGKTTIAKIFAGETATLPIKTRVKIDSFYKLLENIKEKIEKEKVSEVIKYTVKKSGIEDELKNGTEEDLERLENIKELATLALKYDNLEGGAGVEKLLEDASLASDQDSIMHNEEKAGAEKNKNGVRLMTVHASKGLEFKYVFVTGLEYGLFPHSRAEDSPTFADSFGEAREEERRLFYVALTRAKEKLFLSYADFRTIFGSRQINAPSEFLSDIPAHLLEKEGEAGGIKTIYI